MTIDISESKFEKNIESILLQNDYIKRESKDLDKEHIIDIELFCKFIEDYQKENWKNLKEIFGSDIKVKILESYQKELESKPLIDLIRNGLIVSEIKLDCVFFKPVSGMNPESEKLFQSNILSVIRQAVTKLGSVPDLTLCLNGIPVATAELKNTATGQSYDDAIRQYKEDRDPKDKLFSFKRGALVHFAIDPHEVYMTTKLQQDKTIFLPFNKGKDEGKGNPSNPAGFDTAYLWEEIWKRDTWIEIITNFIEHQVIPQKYPLLDKENIIFPRYHQLVTVQKLIKDTKQNGAGKNYLVQHSTGSGKSNTIAWLGYKLRSLHDSKDSEIFDAILILSDRVGIVNQLANTVMQFEHTSGIISAVKDSKELAKNLLEKGKIIISTQQKFPFVLEHIKKVKGKKFAIIIDEAHSSQSAKSREKIQEVLTTSIREESSDYDIVDLIEKEMDIRGQQNTISYYAFTATPKKNTLKLFGVDKGGQENEPFDVYSMKQAIDEGFILDVLRKYSTYESHFSIIKTTSEDKTVEGKKASRALLKYVNSHHLNLSKKSEIIVEHFREHTQQKIAGQAKAMVVSSSRDQALHYKLEIDEYIKKQGYTGINTLVAFSGSLNDDAGNTHTEQSINNTSSDWELREKFDTPDYNILIVAEKYQTGFDQPLLHTMYVDKKLHGVKAVQTLSRLNRTHAGKSDTYVIDFQNNIDEIYNAFGPFYKGTSLVDKTDQAFITKLYEMIMSFDIIIQKDLDTFAEIFFKPESKQTDADLGKMYAITNPLSGRFTDTEEKIQDDFRVKIKKFIESYSFLSQIIRYDETNFEKMYALLRFIINDPPIKYTGSGLFDPTGDVSLKWFRLEKTYDGGILLGEGRNLTMGASYGAPKEPEKLTSLSEVIRSLNDTFGGTISGADKISIEEWFKQLKNDPILREIAKENSFEDFYKQFERKFLNVVIESDNTNQSLVKRIYAQPELQKQLVMDASQIYHTWVKSNGLPPITPSDPARNREIFRQTIYRCKGSISWLDLYLNEAGLDFLIDSFDKKSVKNIKILTGLSDNEYSINERLVSKFKAYQEELKKDGINLEMKIVSTKEGHNKVAHDRYLLGDNIKFNVVSFTLLQKGRFSEIKKTENEIPFDEYWNDSDSYDLKENWDKLHKLSTFDSTCSDCSIDIQLPFKPDGKRPVYCKECYKKYKKQ
jgi:type I restriction enzyme, R subunit